MTSNVGSGLIQEQMEMITDENREAVIDKCRQDVLDLLKRSIRPEFLNRIDETIMFKPLTRDEIRGIVSLQMEYVKDMLEDNDMQVVLTDEAADWIAETGFDPQFGARPLKRIIQRHVLNKLSVEILAGNFKAGDIIKVDKEGDRLVFQVS